VGRLRRILVGPEDGVAAAVSGFCLSAQMTTVCIKRAASTTNWAGSASPGRTSYFSSLSPGNHMPTTAPNRWIPLLVPGAHCGKDGGLHCCDRCGPEAVLVNAVAAVQPGDVLDFINTRTRQRYRAPIFRSRAAMRKFVCITATNGAALSRPWPA
jgi:hypothetical protein